MGYRHKNCLFFLLPINEYKLHRIRVLAQINFPKPTIQKVLHFPLKGTESFLLLMIAVFSPLKHSQTKAHVQYCQKKSNQKKLKINTVQTMVILIVPQSLNSNICIPNGVTILSNINLNCIEIIISMIDIIISPGNLLIIIIIINILLLLHFLLPLFNMILNLLLWPVISLDPSNLVFLKSHFLFT